MACSEALGLTVPYTHAALPLISVFAREAALFHGASEEEAGEVELAMEEAALFIVDAVPDDFAASETFSIQCLRETEGIRFFLRNRGLPVDVNGLPVYASDAPEEHVEGLGLHLMRSLMDEVQFQNHGRQGWETILFKRLSGASKPAAAPPVEQEAAAPSHQETISYTVRQLTPEMAYGLSKLTYHTYGYSYSKDSFYYPDRLAEMIAAGEVESFVACLDSGEIIGHLGLYREKACPVMAEVMLGMVNPGYRRSHCLMRIGQELGAYAMSSDLICCFSGLVTKHMFSQKAAAAFGLKPSALRLSLHPRADYRAIGSAANERESLLDSFLFIKPFPEVVVAMPDAHQDIIARCLNGLNIAWRPCAPDASAVGEAPTQLQLVRQDEIGLAVIRVEQYGSDLAQEIGRLRRQLCRDRLDTLYLFLDLGSPYAASAVPELEAAGFFFSGVRPRTLDHWEILFTFLNNQAVDYDKIQIFDPFGVELLEYIKGCEQRAQERL